MPPLDAEEVHGQERERLGCALAIPVTRILESPPKATGLILSIELLFGQRVQGLIDILKEVWMAQEGEETPAVVHMKEMCE